MKGHLNFANPDDGAVNAEEMINQDAKPFPPNKQDALPDLASSRNLADFKARIDHLRQIVNTSRARAAEYAVEH